MTVKTYRIFNLRHWGFRCAAQILRRGEPLTEPEELKKPCYGFAVDTTARTLELTERGDALRMFRDAVSRLTQP